METNNQNQSSISEEKENKNTIDIKKDEQDSQKSLKLNTMNSRNNKQNDNSSSLLSSKSSKKKALSKKSEKSSLKIEKLVSPDKKKAEIEEISNLIQKLGNGNQTLSKKLNIMKEEDEALVKLFHIFDMQQVKSMEKK